MKSKDLATLILIIGISAIASFYGSNFLFSNKKNLVTKVEVVDPVTSDFNFEDKKYYSEEARPLNPTKDITVSENNNTKPLGQ